MSFASFAAEAIRPDGLYVFNEVKAAQIRDVEIVPRQNSQRYFELVSNKYQCQLVGNFYKCQKHLKDVSLPVELKNEIKSLWRNNKFNFVRSPLSPSLTNEAQSLMEWRIFDQVTFGQEQVSEYDYFLLLGQNEIHKIVLRFNAAPVWLVIENESKLYLSLQKRISSGQFKTRIYELSLFFLR